MVARAARLEAAQDETPKPGDPRLARSRFVLIASVIFEPPDIWVLGQSRCMPDYRPRSDLARAKARIAVSKSLIECAADSCTRILALSLGTTGYENAIT